MTITRDIIRVFCYTIMAVCSTVYIHLYWGSQKTECGFTKNRVCGYKGRLEAIYFTSFDFDYHESKLANVHHILDKFSFN